MASRSRSRSPLNNADSDRSSPTPSHHSSISNHSATQHQRQQKFNTSKEFLKLSNVPLSWKWHNISSYIKRRTLSVDRAIAADITFITMRPAQGPNTGLQESIITFNSESRRNQAYDLLRNTYEKVEGKKLFVHKIDETAAIKHSSHPNNAKVQKFNKKIMQKPNAPFTMEDNDTYGLSVDYLRELEISPPLSRKVFVRYLPPQMVDEAKVRSIFSRAGIIDVLTLVPSKNYINARIEYDHPVEAVQAVSMFNNREFYGKVIKCEIDTLISWRDSNVSEGPGLGPNGTAMRGVRVSVEIKKIREEFTNLCNRLHDSVENLQGQVASLIHSTNQSLNAITTPAVQPPTPVNPVAAPLQNVNNPLTALGNLLTSQLQPMQLLQSLIQQNAGNDISAMGNALQNWTGSNLTNMLQQMQSQMPGGPNMQGGHNMQGGPNMQVGPNMQGGSNIAGGPNTQGGSNMQRGPNMLGGPNNMLNGSNNMPGGPSDNMASRPFNMQSGPGNNMQSGVANNMHSPGPSNMPRGPNVQSGSYNMQGGPSNMQAGPKNMQSGPQNMQSTGFNMPVSQQGMANIQSGYPNMQSSESGSNQQNMNTGFGEPQFSSNNTSKSDATGSLTAMLLFLNLPPTVTQQVLLSKMKEVGEVKLVEMTGPGRALVNYYSEYEADKCFRLYNQSKVDGQTIEVRKV